MSDWLTKDHWTFNAERVSDGDWRIVGEDERGDLYVPTMCQGGPIWRTRFRAWNPRHWPFYFRSRLTNRLAFLVDQ